MSTVSSGSLAVKKHRLSELPGLLRDQEVRLEFVEGDCSWEFSLSEDCPRTLIVNITTLRQPGVGWRLLFAAETVVGQAADSVPDTGSIGILKRRKPRTGCRIY